MKENSYKNNMNELDEEKVNYQELLFRYVIHWSLGLSLLF